MSESIQIGSIIQGKITKIKPFGVIVAIGEGMQGLVHISQISDSYVQDINDVAAIGDIVNVKVLTIDSENNKITLSIKAAEQDGDSKSAASDNRQDFKKSFSDDRTKSSEMSFDEKLKDWIKQSNERQAGINKRNNRR